VKLLALLCLAALASCSDDDGPTPSYGFAAKPKAPADHCPEGPGALADGAPCTVHGDCASCRCAAAGAGTGGARARVCVPACSGATCAAGLRCTNVAFADPVDGTPRGGCVPADVVSPGAGCWEEACGAGGHCRAMAQGEVCFRDCTYQDCDAGRCAYFDRSGDGYCEF
jgi:hypothetical protein